MLSGFYFDVLPGMHGDFCLRRCLIDDIILTKIAAIL